MRKLTVLWIVLVLLVAVSVSSAQLYVGGSLGFKSFGAKGAVTQTIGGTVTPLGISDAGATGFTFGGLVGYQILPPNVAKGVYKLDLQLEVGLSWASMVEAGYNFSAGPGQFTAQGFSGATTANISFDLMPIHRINIPDFKLISPMAGLGIGLNIFSTSDLKSGPPGSPTPTTAAGNSEFTVGLLIFYGAVFNVTPQLQPFIQFKHLIPFASTYTFVSDPTNGTLAINDGIGYFNLSGGVRFSL